MRTVILAWAAGMGIIVYRAAGREHQPPVPGQLLAATGLFALLAAAAEYQPAASAAGLFAVGVDIAVLMQVLPGSAGTTKTRKTASPALKAGAAKEATL
jgi:hypothetical protein